MNEEKVNVTNNQNEENSKFENIDKKVVEQLFLYATNNKKDIIYIRNLLDVYPNILSYMLDENNPIPDLSIVKYVKYKRYNYLRERVLANKTLMQLALDVNFAFPVNILNKLIEYFNNKIISDNINEVILNAIKKYPYDTLCALDGINFIKADKTLLEAARKNHNIWNYKLLTSEQRCISFLTYYLLYNMSGSTIVSINNIKNIMTFKYQLYNLVDVVDKVKYNERFVLINDVYITLKKIYLEEGNIAKFVRKCLDKNNQIIWDDINYKDYIDLDTFTLTEQQSLTLDYITKNQLVLLNGYAGSGKSNTLKALINMLSANNKSCIILAPTARAAQNVSQYTNREAYTIHYYLYKNIFSQNEDSQRTVLDDTYSDILEMEEQNYDDLNYIYEDSHNYIDSDIVIVDEASMFSVSLFNTLIKYINPKHTKLLLVGDSYQLPSISYGNLYHDLLRIEPIPKIFLQEIFRYTDNGLIKIATDIRQGNMFLNSDYIQAGDSYQFQQYTDSKKLINDALNLYLDLIDKYSIENVAILTPKNVGNTGTNLINACAQSVLNPIEWDDTFFEIKLDNVILKIKENDRVMNIKNNYKAKVIDEEGNVDRTGMIINGQIGVVKSITDDGKVVIDFDGLHILYEGSEVYNLRLAYCFTIHKSQGSQFKAIIYLTTSEDMNMINSNILYVGVTRAMEKCYHFGDRHMINNKVKIQENLLRNTTLVQQFGKII